MLEANKQIDLIQILKDKYNYNYQGDNADLIKQPFIEPEGSGVNALFWLTIDGERYLFKPIRESDANIWGELLSKKIADIIGLPCAEYRAAKLGDIKGVLTKDFLKDNERLISGSEFFQNFFNNYPYGEKQGNLIFDEKFRELYEIPEFFTREERISRKKNTFYHLNNVLDIWSLLEATYPNRKETYTIVHNLMKILVFDCITLQGDRHPNNWSIITNGESYYPAPLFDNQISFGLGYQDMEEKENSFKNQANGAKYLGYEGVEEVIYRQKPSLTLQNEYIPEQDMVIRKNHLELFKEIIEKADDETTKFIKQSLAKFNENSIENIIIETEKENGIHMNSSTYFYISYILNYNINKLKEIVKKHEEEITHGTTRK